MKKCFVLLLFLLFFIPNLYAETETSDIKEALEDPNLNKMGFYAGDPSRNKILASGEMYVIVHNSSDILPITVMQNEANEFCKNKLGNNYTALYMQVFGKFTVYFSCEIFNKVDQYDLSLQEKRCILDSNYSKINIDCKELNNKNYDLIQAIELQSKIEKKYVDHNFIFQVRKKYYDLIQENEISAAKQNHFEKINSKMSLQNIEIEQKIEQISKHIEKNKTICKEYSFVEGTESFGECILALLEIELQNK